MSGINQVDVEQEIQHGFGLGLVQSSLGSIFRTRLFFVGFNVHFLSARMWNTTETAPERNRELSLSSVSIQRIEKVKTISVWTKTTDVWNHLWRFSFRTVIVRSCCFRSVGKELTSLVFLELEKLVLWTFVKVDFIILLLNKISSVRNQQRHKP